MIHNNLLGEVREAQLGRNIYALNLEFSLTVSASTYSVGQSEHKANISDDRTNFDPIPLRLSPR